MKRDRRWIVFVLQDGVVLATTIRALAELGILDRSLQGERSIADLHPGADAGFGYLRVGLRCLAAQGWLADPPSLDPTTTVLRWTDAGRRVAPVWDRYAAGGRFLAGFDESEPGAWARPWSQAQAEAFTGLVPPAEARWGLAAELPEAERDLVLAHLDATLAVPAMLALRATGGLEGDAPALPPGELGAGFARLLAAVGWTDSPGVGWNAAGREAAALTVHFGMAASYLPLFARLPELYRGSRVVATAPGGREWHVNRALNVEASAAAHVRYFADADEIFRELFDREPVREQPRFVADTGCGDGSWLVHLHSLISDETLRGAGAADALPLMVGIDSNPAALDRAHVVLERAGIRALLLRGDVSDPAGIAAALAEHGLAIEDGIHVRAFVDHDRQFTGTRREIDREGRSSGAYVAPEGAQLDPAEVERDLVTHLERWAPHVRKHGLVVLEAHCVAPEVARRHLGATHSVAFDSYHGYSHQFPIEHAEFLRSCRAAGLRPASYVERRYPSDRPFTAVSLNRLQAAEAEVELPAPGSGGRDEHGWRPEPGTDLSDGRALHELLYADGDLRYPRLWCSAATGRVVAGALEAIEARLDAGDGGTIRVIDYGCGTGLAAIELLKACRERAVEDRLAETGAELELYLVDLPSSWFAYGHRLLHDCAWVRFRSLRAEGGGFRRLTELTGGEPADVVIANMVFHLIRGNALRRAAAELAGVTATGGRLWWSSPDLGPCGPFALLFHDANRALRQRWLELLEGAPVPSPGLAAAVEAAAGREPVAAGDAQARADRRVLPQANSAGDVTDALAASFGGESVVERPTHEILAEDLIATLLVPSNQAEYLAEVPDEGLRRQVVEELMREEVLPRLRAGPAGTALGLNVQWTIGSVRRARHA